jgi:hypothetical protein
VENCYSLSNNANGFAFSGTAVSSYFDKDLVSGISTKPEGKTTAEMQAQGTYAGWDFTSIWDIDGGYPFLRNVDGVDGDGYTEVHTASDLRGISQNLVGSYRLMADIDLEGELWVPVGTSSKPFDGIFDGNGYTISNLNVDLASQDYVGMFGYSRGYIKDLNVENATIKGRSYVGGLAGGSGGRVQGCSLSGLSVTGGSSYVGGLAGYSSGIITGCSVSGAGVSGSSYVGGLAGYAAGGVISQSYSSVDVKGSSSSSYTGGLVGMAQSVTIEQCYATGHVSGSASSYSNGGVIQFWAPTTTGGASR